MSSIRPCLFQNHSDLGSDFIQSDNPRNLHSGSSLDGVSKSEPVRILDEGSAQWVRIHEISLQSKLLNAQLNDTNIGRGKSIAEQRRCPISHLSASTTKTPGTQQIAQETSSVIGIQTLSSSILERNDSKAKCCRSTSLPPYFSKHDIHLQKEIPLFERVNQGKEQDAKSCIQRNSNQSAQEPLLKYEQCELLQKEWNKICKKQPKKNTCLQSIEQLEKQKQQSAARNKRYRLSHRNELSLKKSLYRLEHKKEEALRQKMYRDRIKQKLQAIKSACLRSSESQVQ